jgi:hypothetical protein
MATPSFYPDRDINNLICYPIAISFPIGKYRTIIERKQTKSIPIGKTGIQENAAAMSGCSQTKHRCSV